MTWFIAVWKTVRVERNVTKIGMRWTWTREINFDRTFITRANAIGRTRYECIVRGIFPAGYRLVP